MKFYTDKKIAMISQPMGGKTDKEILAVKNEAVKWLYDHNYRILTTFFNFNHDELENKGYKNIGLYYLAKSLESMSACDTVYFCNGWESARGCYIEHEVAVKYGLELIYQEIEEVED